MFIQAWRIGEQIISEGIALQKLIASYYDILDTYPDFLYKVGEYLGTHCSLTGLPFLKAHVLDSCHDSLKGLDV